MRWWRVGVLAGCLTVVTFLCAAAFTWWAWSVVHPESEAGTADLQAVVTGTGRIALVGEDGNIWTVSPDGKDLVAITDDASRSTQIYRYPTWSPDGRMLAFVELPQDAVPIPSDSALHLLATESGERQRIPTDFPPFYLYWSPTSEMLAFLSNWTTGGLALRMVDVAGDAHEVITIARGNPFYFSWNPDGAKMLAHIGGEELVLLDQDGHREPLDVEPGLFQAPHWSEDGERLAFVTEAEGTEDTLVVADASGENVAEVSSARGLFTFNWSPDNRRLAYSFTLQRIGLAGFGPLWVRDLEANRAWELSKMPVVAFFWSPDGKKVAFLRPELRRRDQRPPQASPPKQESRLWFRWHIWNGERTYPLARFSPTRSFLLDYLRYFDQYAQSVSLWSPDSQTLLYAGTGEDGRRGIWTLPVEESSTPQRIARGVLATWSSQ
ncbi:MAG: hypothetical protein M3220_01560 [Chloroflexota bacterium]|nr:hypothetical protein [Chloroflexota bacterium]